MKKVLLVLIAVLTTIGCLNAQTNVGIGTSTPNAGAQLDVTAVNRGFLPPRLALSANNVWSLAGAPTEGMMVFNTASSGSGATAVAPGLYVWINSQWNQVYFQNGTAQATFIAATLNCGNIPAGSYVQGQVMNSSNTKTITITAATAGTYNVTTNAQNGVTFAASGTLLSTGNSSIILTASGTPSSTGTFNYTISLAGQSCTFPVIFYGSGATFACNNAVSMQTPIGALVNGTSYGGTYTLPYTAGNGQSYGSITQLSNGLTISRVGGSFAAGGGNVVYQLSGTYTGASNNFVTFVLPEGCTINYGDAIRSALASVGCASCVAYDTAAFNDAISITALEYSAILSMVNNSSQYGAQTSLMNTTPISYTGFWFPLLASTGVSFGGIPVNNYVCALWAKSGSSGSPGNKWLFTNGNSQTSCSNISWTLGNLGPQIGNTNSYWAVKRPSTANPYNPGAISAGYGIAPCVYNSSVAGYFDGLNFSCTSGGGGSANYIATQVIATPTKGW